MSHRPASSRLLPGVGILLLALWYGGTLWATDQGVRNVEAHTTLTPPLPAATEPWRAMRFFGDPDAYQWLSFARDLRASGHFRVRWTRADNVPCGRAVHWAQLPIWSLVGLSFALERVAGVSPPVALEWAGRLLMPLAGFLFCTAILLMLARWTRPAIGLFAAMSIAISCLYDFHPLRPDHHGFQIAFGVCSLLCLLGSGMGRFRTGGPGPCPGGDLLPTLASARRRFVASGIFGGMALWMGATVFAFILFAVAAGTAFALFLSSPAGARDGGDFHPDLFRWWGVAGAGSALFFYLLEYAPAHFSMRLEVNHPLYALCFLGTAECLRAIACWKQDRAAFRRRDALFAGLGILAAAVLPALVLFGPVAGYIPRTPLMLRLHSRFIIEFLPLWQTASAKICLDHALLFLLGGATLLLTENLLRRQRLPGPYEAPLRLLAILSVWIFLLFLWQVRWLQFLAPFFILFAAFCLAALLEGVRAHPLRHRSASYLPLLLGFLAVAQTAQAAGAVLHPLRQIWRVEKMDELWVRYMLQRNLMLQLKAVGHGERLRLLLPAEMATAAYYFGLGEAVGSLYWENLEGLTATAEFLGDPLPGRRAREIARERGLTHVLLNQNLNDASMFYHLLTGKTDRSGLLNTVGGALSDPTAAELPDWLTPDEGLSRLASRSYFIFIPAISQWLPLNIPVRIYAVQPMHDSPAPPAPP